MIKVDLWGYQLRLIALTKTLIILDITKTESNNCFIIHWRKQKNSCLCFFTDGKQNKASELDMITLRNHAPRHDYRWPWVSLAWLLNNMQLWRHGRWLRKFTMRFRPVRKEIASSMYNNVNTRTGTWIYTYAMLKRARADISQFVIVKTNWRPFFMRLSCYWHWISS